MSIVIKVNLALSLFFLVFTSSGQSNSEAENSNYVVVGAFGVRENAAHFVEAGKPLHPTIKFELNPVRELYYVYVLNSDDRVQAFAEARRLRKLSKYWDTWVYFGKLGESDLTAGATQGGAIANKKAVSKSDVAKNDESKEAAVKALSMTDEPTGLNLGKMIGDAKTQQQKDHYEGIQEVQQSVSKLDKTTKVIVFKDDEEGRKVLSALGYDIEEGKSVTGFFDSKNNILAINATESQSDEPFHEGLEPVVKFLRKKDPAMFESFAKEAQAIKNPMKGITYGELNATSEEALANMLSDVAKGYFENAEGPKAEATTLMGKILETLGVAPPDLALSSAHLKATSNNLAIAVREATGFDAEGNRKFRFDLFNTMNHKQVNGEVDLVNEAGKKLVSYSANTITKVERTDASGNIILACEVLGYRKLLFKLNYDNPFLTDGVVRGEDEEAIVPFGLVRLQKGDIAVMYNVYFFKDAAIMRPESRYEINNLLEMMKENEKYKILLHGHTNGNAAGKIITMGGSNNYFSLSDTKEGRGSAKKLSEERAEVIKAYLVDQGVAADRMEIKAWGGKRPLYDKNHSLAQSNVRVEVEIVEN